MTPYVLISG